MNDERETTTFTSVHDIENDLRGALAEITRLRQERDTFAYRLNRLDDQLEALLKDSHRSIYAMRREATRKSDE